jgi:hypothetical protein
VIASITSLSCLPRPPVLRGGELSSSRPLGISCQSQQDDRFPNWCLRDPCQAGTGRHRACLWTRTAAFSASAESGRDIGVGGGNHPTADGWRFNLTSRANRKSTCALTPKRATRAARDRVLSRLHVARWQHPRIRRHGGWSAVPDDQGQRECFRVTLGDGDRPQLAAATLNPDRVPGFPERLAEPQCTDPLDPSGGILSSISISASGSSSGN